MKRIIRSFLTLLFVLCFALSCAKKEVSVVKVGGSTTIEPIARKAGEILYKKNNIALEIVAKGSHKGIDLLIHGLCDIAESSVRISDHERELASREGVVLHEYIIAQDLIVPIVHKDNTINDLSIKDLRDIYTGKKKTWQEYGWESEAITPVARGKDSGTGDIWNSVILQNQPLASFVLLKNSNTSVLLYVSENPGAIGYVSYGFVNSDIKTLSINGIKARVLKDSINGYPLTRKLYLYGNESKMSDAARSFIVFLLSNEGQKIISEEGFIPLGYNE